MLGLPVSLHQASSALCLDGQWNGRCGVVFRNSAHPAGHPQVQIYVTGNYFGASLRAMPPGTLSVRAPDRPRASSPSRNRSSATSFAASSAWTWTSTYSSASGPCLRAPTGRRPAPPPRRDHRFSPPLVITKGHDSVLTLRVRPTGSASGQKQVLGLVVVSGESKRRGIGESRSRVLREQHQRALDHRPYCCAARLFPHVRRQQLNRQRPRVVVSHSSQSEGPSQTLSDASHASAVSSLGKENTDVLLGWYFAFGAIRLRPRGTDHARPKHSSISAATWVVVSDTELTDSDAASSAAAPGPRQLRCSSRGTATEAPSFAVAFSPPRQHYAQPVSPRSLCPADPRRTAQAARGPGCTRPSLQALVTISPDRARHRIGSRCTSTLSSRSRNSQPVFVGTRATAASLGERTFLNVSRTAGGPTPVRGAQACTRG